MRTPAAALNDTDALPVGYKLREQSPLTHNHSTTPPPYHSTTTQPPLHLCYCLIMAQPRYCAKQANCGGWGDWCAQREG